MKATGTAQFFRSIHLGSVMLITLHFCIVQNLIYQYSIILSLDSKGFIFQCLTFDVKATTNHFLLILAARVDKR